MALPVVVRDSPVQRRLPAVVLLLSLAAHAWSFLYVCLFQDRIPILYVTEYLSLIALSAVLEGVGYWARTIVLFRVLYLFRTWALFVSFVLLEGRSVIIAVLLSAPLLAEVVVYDSERAAAILSGLALAILAAGVVSPILGSDPVQAVSCAFYFILTVCTTTGSVWLAIHYREILVETDQQLGSLHSTVANLMEANRAYQSYAGGLASEAATKERNRIAQDLHDTIGHALTSVVVMMNAARALLKEDPSSLDEILRKTCLQAEEALNQTRQILYRLRNMPTDEAKGLQAVHRLVSAFQGATGIRVFLDCGNLPISLGQRLDSILYRLVQEGLTNAFRHGKATDVDVHFWITENEIRAKVHDNGHGVAQDRPIEEGMGLRGMRERIAVVGGHLSPRGVPDGFVLEACIPYRRGLIDG